MQLPISATGQVSISNQPAAKVVVFGNSKLNVKLDYDLKCVITRMNVNGEQVVSEKAGIKIPNPFLAVNVLIHGKEIEYLF